MTPAAPMPPTPDSAPNEPDLDDADAWWAVAEACGAAVALVDVGASRVARKSDAFRRLEQRHQRVEGRRLVDDLASRLTHETGGGALRFEVPLTHGPSTHRAPLAIAAAPAAGRPGCWLVGVQGVGDQAALAPESRDTVTGIADRRALEADLARRFALARPFAVVFVDLDGFKQINDTRGHLAGDDALREIASRLSECLRESDLIGRFGGDEFVVLLDGAASEGDVKPIVARVEAAVGRPLESVGGRIVVSASMGWALSSGDYPTPRDMLSAADHRMYASKRSSAGPPG